MAELASGIAEKVLEKLGFLASEEFSLVLYIKNDLGELKHTMSTIKSVLLDAEEKQASNHVLSGWLRQLKDIFYEAEDVLDEVECEVLRKQVLKKCGRTIRREVRDFFPCSVRAIAFRCQLGHKIKNIRKRLGKIAAEKDQFNLAERNEDRHVMHRRRDMTHSYVPPSDVIGRKDDKENMIGLLRQPDAKRSVNIIPIVGLGGLGKTTIAQLVYDDKRVAEYFDLRMWICVSEDFDVARLIREILKELGVRIDERSSTINTWQSNLREKLENKKFLLVLDDVWNEDRSKWFDLEQLLSGGSNGSRIVVTTRSHLVASIVGTVPTYTLEALSHDDCLSLFVKWAFKEGEEKQYPNLLEIGNEIVKKCKGVPLAIRTLGSLLFSKVDEREWKFVRDNKIWKLEQKEGDILPALKLSYDQMPSHLKQCFAFCSVFQKDHGFDSDELIAFWMAHGLLNKMPDNSQNLELEDVGDMYIKELFSRSFFQEVTHHFWYYRFKMHDLVHDLALKVAEEECSSIELYTQNISGTIRHLSFPNNCLEFPPSFYTVGSGVRTILLMVQQVPTLIETCISRFKCLRLLEISNITFEVLPSSIGTLKHLRYLNLSGSPRMKKLPDSICNLYNLQTLLLHYCPRLERLPKDTRKMINLRYLTVTTTYTRLFENGVCSLNSLRVLRISNCPRLEVLFQGMDGWLTKLRTLVVEGCDRLTSLTHDIKHLTALEILVIQTCEELNLTEGEDDHDLKFSLRKLLIEGLQKLEVLPQWVQGSASTLQFLRISMCHNLTALPEWLSSLKSLHTLEIIGCSKLSSLPERMDSLTALRELTIENCPELIRKCRQEDWSKIVHIPTVQLLDGPKIEEVAASMT